MTDPKPDNWLARDEEEPWNLRMADKEDYTDEQELLDGDLRHEKE